VGAPLEDRFLSKAHHSVSPVIYFSFTARRDFVEWIWVDFGI
jgi:hypothetical protein